MSEVLELVPVAVWVTLIVFGVRYIQYLTRIESKLNSIEKKVSEINGKVAEHETRLSRQEGFTLIHARENG